MTVHAEREAAAKRVGRRAPLIGGIAAVVAGVLLGVLINVREHGLPFTIDEEWAEEMVDIRDPVGDWLALVMNSLGGGVIGVFVVPVVVAVLLLLARRPWGALYFIVASAVSAGVVQLLKRLFGRPRPDEILVTSDFGSFPSGHVANAAVIAVALGVIVPHVWVWVLGAVYTVLMAVSRTYLGAHWLSDTIGGMLVGAGVALLIWAAFAYPLERERLAWDERRADRRAVVVRRSGARLRVPLGLRMPLSPRMPLRLRMPRGRRPRAGRAHGRARRRAPRVRRARPLTIPAG